MSNLPPKAKPPTVAELQHLIADAETELAALQAQVQHKEIALGVLRDKLIVKWMRESRHKEAHSHKKDTTQSVP